MPDPLILYSATTRLAYNLAQRYYGGEHYVWCAPQQGLDPFAFTNPPSSEPFSIYWRCHADVVNCDAHSAAIDQNRRGLVRGATVKESSGVIDATTRSIIEAVAMQAPISDFSPLLFVIPFADVRAIAKTADMNLRARATSEEYIIENLPRNLFDVLELHR